MSESSIPSQASTGLYRLLFHPLIYDLVQRLLGADRTRRWIVNDVMKLQPGSRVLDVGCGTGELLPYLGDVEYMGLDNNPEYIEKARSRYGESSRHRFLCASVDDLGQHQLGQFDRILAVGVLHHLNDESCRQIFRAARGQLSPSGLVITGDPCYFPGQSWFTRWVTSLDRGKNVRSPLQYRGLAGEYFDHLHSTLKFRPNALPITSCIVYGATSREALQPVLL